MMAAGFRQVLGVRSGKLRNVGFTLIEVMIVVVIIGILAGIAYPSYQGYMRQNRGADGKLALTQIAAQQERFFTECSRYASSITATRDCTNLGLGLTATSPEGHYTLALAQGILLGDNTVSPNCSAWTCGFTATATPQGRQAQDGALRINSLGQRFWDRNNDTDFADANETRWRK